MPKNAAVFFPLALALAACSTSSPGTQPHADSGSGTPSDASAADGLAAPAAADGIQIRQTFAAFPPGAEVHNCSLYALPDRDIEVGRFEHTFTSGGHHVIVYPTALTEADMAAHPGVFDCEAVMPNRGNIGFSYVGGGTEGSQEFPSGVAWHFDPKQIVMLESHMLNLGDKPLDVDYRVNLRYAKGPVKDHVGTIFFYDNQIYIPEKSTYAAAMTCNVPSDIHVLALATHMHVRGTHFRSALMGGDLSSPKSLANSDDWANIEPTRFSPPLDVAAGQHFDVACDYENPDDFPIVSGPSKTRNEMCLLIGAYYPRLDFPFEFCMTPHSGPTYDGTQTCGQTLGCFIASPSPTGPEAQQCATKTCAASSAVFNDFFSCVAQSCFFPGKCTGDGGSNCNACAVANCGPQMATCQSTGCN